MNPVEWMLSEPFGQTLGWTLLHFVWQGLLVASLLAVALHLLRRATAATRYAVACGAMVVLLALPLVTFSLLLPTPGGMQEAASAQALESAFSGEAGSDTGALFSSSSLPTPAWQQARNTWLGAALLWFVLAWMVGVLTLSLGYLTAWTYTLHLRHKGVREVGPRWHAQREDLARRMGITRAVRLVSSARVQVPTVAGWIRPVILLPVSVFTGLTPCQVEMIIAHELAHIRRYDYLVNLMQVVCETLLFYHPAVWWISRRIRIEREHCCDDLVVSICGDTFAYVEALTRLEHVRQATPRLAMAATGGSLLNRIRRLVEGPAESTPRTAHWIVGLVLLGAFLLSLQLSTAFAGIWEKTYDRLTGQETARTSTSGATASSLLVREGYEQTAAMLEQLIFEDQSRSIQLEALDELRELPASASLLSLIHVASRHPRERVRNEAVQWVGRLGDAYVVPALEQIAFEDPSTFVQLEALDALRNLPDNIGIPSLVKIAQTHPRRAMRQEAVQWIARLGGDAARPTLERILYEDADPSVQLETFDALRDLPRGISTQTLEQVSEQHPSEEVRRQAAAVWTSRRTRQAAFNALSVQRMQQMQQQRASVRRGDHYEDTAAKLERLIFEDADPSVQQEAFNALRNLPGSVIVAPLVKISETHPDEALRAEAVIRLKEASREDALLEKMQAALAAVQNHPEARQRAEAVQTLKVWKDWKSSRVFTVLTNSAFNDADEEVRMEALDALRDRGGLEAMARLARIARTHDSATMRSEAIQSMDAMHTDDLVDVLEEIIFRDPSLDVQMEALDLLKDLPEARSVPILIKVAQRERLPTPLRREAFDALEECNDPRARELVRQLDR